MVHLPLEMFQTPKIEPNNAEPGSASFGSIFGEILVDGDPVKIVHKGEILRIIFTKIIHSMDTQ